MTYIFLISNLLIVAGYLIVAVGIAPHFKSTVAHTRVGGIFFFALCGATHLEFIVHWLYGSGIDLEEYGSFHMVLIHAIQAIAVMLFLAGLYFEQKVEVQGLPWFAKAVDRFLMSIIHSKPITRAVEWVDRNIYPVIFVIIASVIVSLVVEGA